MFEKYKNNWKTCVNTARGGQNKLRTYTTFKTSFETELYLKCYSMSRVRRSALAKLRLDVAPRRIETGRYEGVLAHEQSTHL